MGFIPFPSPLREVADLVLLASALLRNFEGRPLLPAHDRLPCAVPFHCVDDLRSLSARDVERVKRSSGSSLHPLLWARLEVKVPKHALLKTLRVVPRARPSAGGAKNPKAKGVFPQKGGTPAERCSFTSGGL